MGVQGRIVVISPSAHQNIALRGMFAAWHASDYVDTGRIDAVSGDFLRLDSLLSSRLFGLQVWLQEFAWTEEDKEEDMCNRSRSRDRLSSKDADRLQKQPMFCMETAINMFYWSVLVYDHEEVLPFLKQHSYCRHACCAAGWKASMGTGLQMHGLAESAH